MSGTSADAFNETSGDLYYGITVSYADARNPDFSHQLVLFNRCYGLVDGSVVLNPSVRTPGGASEDCLSKEYLAQGEVSQAALVVHDFQRSKHAFPAAEMTEF